MDDLISRKRGRMKKLDKVIERFNHNAEYERTNGNLQGCLEFRQLAEWLGELKKLKEQTEPCEDCISRQNVHIGTYGERR